MDDGCKKAYGIGNVCRCCSRFSSTSASGESARMRSLLCGWIVALSAALPALADDRLPTAYERGVMETTGFLDAHPDMRYRIQGQRELAAGRHSVALEHFKRASRYADKASQAMVAEMLWSGKGVSEDRASAYAWMDLAAERGYEGFVVHRERYWARLTDSERARALDAGAMLYETYGDDAARPRLARVMYGAKLRTVGARPSMLGRYSDLFARTEEGTTRVFQMNEYYSPRLWDESKYQAIQDATWERIPNVHVGDIETAGDPDDK